jgi:hypothetical protein
VKRIKKSVIRNICDADHFVRDNKQGEVHRVMRSMYTLEELILKHLQTLEKGDYVTFTYTNYKGETSERKAFYMDVLYGATKYHPEEQFFMVGVDYDKVAIRTYAVENMANIRIETGTMYFPSDSKHMELMMLLGTELSEITL